jgi:hypothetical protein
MGCPVQVYCRQPEPLSSTAGAALESSWYDPAMRILLTLFFCLALGVSGADGVFEGKWESSASGSAGKLRMKFGAEPDASFTLNGSEFKDKVVRADLREDTVELVFDFVFDGADLQSVLTGTRRGGKLEGKYRTVSKADNEPVDGRTFEAAQTP